MDKTPEELKKEKAHLTEILSNLETSYRNAKVSEKNYNEVKDSSNKRISEIDAALSKQPSDSAPAAKEENLAGDFTSETASSMTEEVDVATSEKPKQDADVELEKIKVLVETTRDEMKALQETVQGISESIGEVRSMAFQSEGLAKELEVKIEKSQDDINEIKPSEISKRIRKIDESLEKIDIYDEKAETKFADLSKKINLVYEMMKSAGGIENLSGLNREIGKKADEIKEAMHYIERLAAKTEKAFIEINKNLEDFHVYKSRQDNLEDAIKEMIKSLDESNLRIDNSATKKELSSASSDMMLLKKQMDEISRVIPLIKVKLPEQIQKLTKEKDEVSAMLDLLDGQVKTGAISAGEYEKLKKANESKMKKIEEQLEEEWKRFERLAESGELETMEAPIQLPTQPVIKEDVSDAKPIENNSNPPVTVEVPKPEVAKPPEPEKDLPVQQGQTSATNNENEVHEPEKRKRGRPRKHPEEKHDNHVDDVGKSPEGSAVIPENMKKMIEEAFENNEMENVMKETFENPETAKLYEQPPAKPEEKTDSHVLTPPVEKKHDEIDDFVKEVADKYIGDEKAKEEFIKSVGENEAGSEKTDDQKNEKKKEEKKGKTFEIAKSIKEMM